MALVAEYKLNNSLNDTSGNSRHGTVSGTEQYGSGKINEAFSYDGNTIIKIPNITGSVFTICGWFYGKQNGYLVQLNGKYALAADKVFRWKDGYTIYGSNDVPAYCEYIDVGASSDGGWHFVALVASGDGNIIAWKDGNKYTSIVQSNVQGYTNEGYSYLGTSGLYQGSYYAKANGLHDHIKIFDHALTDQEIKNEYTGLMAEYKFEDSTTDSSGNNYTPIKSGLTYANGKVNRCAYFSGSSPHIRVDSLASIFNGNNPWSISGWIKHPANSSTYHLFCMSNTSSTAVGGERAIAIEMDNSISPFGKLSFKRLNDTPITTDYAYDDDKWHHIVCTYDGINLKVYIDYNKEQKSVVSASSALSQTVFGLGTYIRDPSLFYWKGHMDQIRVYNYALSDSEVKDLYLEPFIAEYKLENNTWDASGHNRHATGTDLTYIEGKKGTAIHAPIKTSRILCPSKLPPYFSGRKPFTIACWIKGDEYIIYHYYFSGRSPAGGNGLEFLMYNDGTIWAGRYDMTWARVKTTKSYNDNNWHFVVFIYDYTYLILNIDNGAEIVTASSAASVTIDELSFSWDYYWGYNNGAGYLDQIRMYAYALSSQEISDLYNESINLDKIKPINLYIWCADKLKVSNIDFETGAITDYFNPSYYNITISTDLAKLGTKSMKLVDGADGYTNVDHYCPNRKYHEISFWCYYNYNAGVQDDVEIRLVGNDVGWAYLNLRREWAVNNKTWLQGVSGAGAIDCGQMPDYTWLHFIFTNINYTNGTFAGDG